MVRVDTPDTVVALERKHCIALALLPLAWLAWACWTALRAGPTFATLFAGLGAEPRHLAVIDVYCVHPIHRLLPDPVFARLGPAAIHGVRWHPCHPPIEGLAFEMDLRGVGREVWLR